MKKIAIIGSGMAGAALAYALQDFAEITVFEKARGIGGRLSTRYKDDFEFDLGAPFFQADTPNFHSMMNTFIKQGVIAQWPFRELKHNDIELKKGYVGLPRMNDFPKFLLRYTKVCLEHKVTKVQMKDNAWMLIFENQAPEVFDWVITTAPPLQSKALLPVNFEYHDLLAEVKFEPSLILMLGLRSSLDINWDCYQMDSEHIFRCIINSNKPNRHHALSLVVQASTSFSKENLDNDESNVIEALMKALKQFIAFDESLIDYQALHKWRYATAAFNKAIDLVCFDSALGLGVCGDWTEGGGVEAAYLSGLRMGQTLRKMILGTHE